MRSCWERILLLQVLHWPTYECLVKHTKLTHAPLELTQGDGRGGRGTLGGSSNTPSVVKYSCCLIAAVLCFGAAVLCFGTGTAVLYKVQSNVN